MRESRTTRRPEYRLIQVPLRADEARALRLLTERERLPASLLLRRLILEQARKIEAPAPLHRGEGATKGNVDEQQDLTPAKT